MARFNYTETANYGGQGGGGFFSLRNVGDTARVRFLYNSAEDVAGYSVHEIILNGKKRNLNCIRTYDQDTACCPFCRAGQYQKAKIFIPLYMEDEDRVCTWDRGKTYIKKMAALCEMYAQDKPMASIVFEIRKTAGEDGLFGSFEITPLYADDMTVEDLCAELPNVEGGIILNKTFEEMENYLETGDFRKIDYTDRSDRYGRSRAC